MVYGDPTEALDRHSASGWQLVSASVHYMTNPAWPVGYMEREYDLFFRREIDCD